MLKIDNLILILIVIKFNSVVREMILKLNSRVKLNCRVKLNYPLFLNLCLVVLEAIKN